MKKYRQGKFRNQFERVVFERVRETLEWCMRFASTDYPYSVKGEVYHNVQTIDFHGELSVTDTFSDPQSREIDALVELEQPKRIRLLISAKESAYRQSLEHLGDYEGLLNALRSNANGWLYWALVVARRGFQSGCEETAKRGDIALVPPITGDTGWINVITEEEVLDRVSDALKVFVLGESWRRDANSYSTGEIYNAVFVATREPSGMPGATRIRKGSGREIAMKDFISDALREPRNRFRIPISRRRTYVPFFDAPTVQSVSKEGATTSAPVASVIVSTASGMRFFKVRTETGRELIADGQRALYMQPRGRTSRKLIRVDGLKAGIRILCAGEDGKESRLEVVTSFEELGRDGPTNGCT
jgi:hypothetical protein